MANGFAAVLIALRAIRVAALAWAQLQLLRPDLSNEQEIAFDELLLQRCEAGPDGLEIA